MKILADQSLKGLDRLYQAPFILTTYSNLETLQDLLPEQDILLCRATVKISEQLIQNTKLKCIASASSGTDHIDKQALIKHKIDLFDAKGCNAASVSDYIIACLAYLSRAELLEVKTAGIIGYGEVGRRLHPRLLALGFTVVIYDPLKASIEANFNSCNLEDLYDCELLCLHANLHQMPPFSSHHLINESVIKALKPNSIIINAARGELVDEKALLLYGQNIQYCTDVYAREPELNRDIVDKALLCTPHIAGHSLDGKHNAINIVTAAIHRYVHLQANDLKPLPPVEYPAYQAHSPWQENILSLYQPYDETQQLKAAHNLESCFLTLRAAHNKRRDFSAYHHQHMSQFWKALTGQ